MKKLLGIVVLGLLYCSFGFAESTLPKCKDYSKSWNNKIDLNNARSKWTDCYGKYIKNWDKKFNFEFEGEYINGKANGAGQFTYKTKDGKSVASYEGLFLDGRISGFGIYKESNNFKEIQYLDKNGIGFVKRFYPEGDIYIGQIKRLKGLNRRHGKGLQTTYRSIDEGKYAIFNEGFLTDNIPLDEIIKFEEDILVFEAKLKSMEECNSYGIKINSLEFEKCSKKYLEVYINELSQKRIDKIAKFKLRDMSGVKAFKEEGGKLSECVSFTVDGYCAHTIPYEIKSKKYTNNKYDAQELIKLGLILTSNNNNYSNSQPRLFYEKTTGRMLECSGRVTIGKCSSFNYNTNSYNSNTLFYNSKTGAMQECAMQSRGKCNSFRSSIKIPGRDQLFYDKRSNSMRTCMSNTINGKCVSFGMAPSHRTKNKNTGSYIVDSPVNPYYKKVPRTNTQLINLGLNMLSGRCTLGLNC